MPGVGYVSLSLQLHHASAGELRGQKAALEHLALVAVAMHHKDRTPDLAADRLHLLPRARDRIVLIHHHHVSAAVEPISDCILDLLGRMRLRKHLGEEEVEKVAVVAAHVVLVELEPALVAFEDVLVDRDRPHPVWMSGREMRNARCDRDDAENPLVMRSSQLDRREDAVGADADKDRGSGRGHVHHRDAVGGVALVAPQRGRVWKVG